MEGVRLPLVRMTVNASPSHEARTGARDRSGLSFKLF